MGLRKMTAAVARAAEVMARQKIAGGQGRSSVVADVGRWLDLFDDGDPYDIKKSFDPEAVGPSGTFRCGCPGYVPRAPRDVGGTK